MFSLLRNFECASLTIDEILSSVYEPLPPDQRSEQLARQRLACWIDVSADGDAGIFAKRLARENRSLESVLERLGGVRRREGMPEPGWVGRTRHVVKVLIGDDTPLPRDELAFAPLLAPLLRQAASALQTALPQAVLPLLAPPAFEGAVDHLRRRLSNLCELPFYEILLGWRRGLVAAASAGDEFASQQLLANTLDTFAAYLRDDGYAKLLRDKPILFRLLAMLVEQWHDSYLAFFQRYVADRERIAHLLGQADVNARLCRINWGASDPHNGGYSVFIAEFEDGRRVLYKPKDLGPDRFVGSIMVVLANLGLPEPLVVPEAIVCEGYGWTQFIARTPCANEREVASYYRRFGAWLALFHVLSTSDMHMENFIAHGDHPVPVDLEMVLQGLRQPPKSVDDATQAHWLVAHFIEDSVQSVGMLPAYAQGQDGALISMGALEPSVYPVQVFEWDDANTPRMLLRSATQHIEIATNLPMLEGQPVPVVRFRDNFLAGFDETMHFVARHRDAVLAAVEAAAHHALTIRKVVRPTRFYYMLLKRLYDHRNMHDAVAWSLEADFVARLYDWDSDNEEPWKLAGSERRQLHELGIPHFTMQTTSNIIGDRHGPVTRLHVDLGHDVARSRLASLAPATIDIQAGIVRACLQMPHDTQPRASTPGTQHAASFARTVQNALLELSFRAPHSLAWLGLNRVDHEVAAQLGPLGHDLYYGSTGIALFLAALAKDGDLETAQQCRNALAATLKLVNSSRLAPLGRALGVGGAVGLGSIVYALAYASDILSDVPISEAADACARAITVEAICADDKFDLVAGAAGACMALLALHRRTGAPWLVERAILCGDHLLAHRSAAHGMWVSSAFTSALTGVAHGAAGMALAFSRLYAASGEARFRQAAQDCVEFENKHIDTATGNWIDLRATQEAAFARTPNQWCYGAAGIGLARLAMHTDGAVERRILDQDVERALAVALRDEGNRSACLCCGDAGHIEFLAVAGATLDRPELRAVALQRLVRLQAEWERTGELKWIGGATAYSPGLFQGLAGIGFSALRVTGTQLPSPLVWD